MLLEKLPFIHCFLPLTKPMDQQTKGLNKAVHHFVFNDHSPFCQKSNHHGSTSFLTVKKTFIHN